MNAPAFGSNGCTAPATNALTTAMQKQDYETDRRASAGSFYCVYYPQKHTKWKRSAGFDSLADARAFLRALADDECADASLWAANSDFALAF